MKPTLPSLPLAIITGLLLAAGPAAAQMAEGLDTADLAPAAAPAPGSLAAATPASAQESSEILPSRYAADELPAYVRQLSARFSIRKRATDPFGRYQDPNYVAPAPKMQTKSPTQRFKPEPPVPFSDVVAGISINTVIPAKQQFLIGNRMFRVNDLLALRLPNGKQLNAKVLAVSSSRIRFRNVTTNETADLTLNLLPAGMKKGTANITAPGFEAVNSQAPVDIQPILPLSTN